MGSWPIQLARHVQDHGCCWHHDALSSDDLSGLISAQWERDPVILQAYAKHWRYGWVKVFWVCLTVCGRALSCWKIPALYCCKYDTTTGSIIPSQYLWAVRLQALWWDLSSHHDVCPPKPSCYHPHNSHVRRHYLGPAAPLVSFKAAISKWHVKPGFVWKQNAAPLPASPALMNPGTLASCFIVSQRQRNTNVGTPRFQSSGV